MDQRSATRLLNETFNNPFDLSNFTNFIKELFNNFTVSPRSWNVWQEYLDYIESYKLLGSYKDNSKKIIDVLIVKLKKTSSIDRARTMQRNFIAKYLSNAEKDAALVAFYGEDPQDWRFSFVKMEYQLTKDADGKTKILKELTPAKRYSFLVGKNEPNHTCRKQFLKLIMEEEVNPSIEEIEAAFSIENVTKEFFLEYKNLYLKLKDSLEKISNKNTYVKKEFEQKGISIVDFAKKLLGQIVFIYFLQKKGWLGVEKDEKGRFNPWGFGPKNFLRKLFDKEIVPYDDFFNDILEPLFYEALATERDDDYYSRFNCKIPFLNGGLFEPINDYDWAGTEILLDNSIFEHILDTFDRFNFTVKEDEPLEKEVAIDPEMLGKVFENLIEENIRKGQGAYYTPREIVHYMCQQSLINYLETNTNLPRKDIEKFIQLGDLALDLIIKEQEQVKKYGRSYDIKQEYTLPKSIKENYLRIDELLKEIKIVDPAVGSGAFPVGMMNEIVKARSVLSIFFSEQEKKKRTSYNLKRETIENSLYGVDIDSSAVDIAKLRFWLSLIVDELDMRNIKPLPNLDHKIMCGNSLLEEFEGIKLFDEKLLGTVEKDYSYEIKRIEYEISKLYQELGKIHTGKQKNENGRSKEIQKRIKKLQKQRNELMHGKKINERNLTLEEASEKRIRESQKKLKELKELQKKFFNEQNRKLKKQLRKEIDKIEWDLIEETLKEQGNEEAIRKLQEYKKNKSKPFFLWKLYFSEVFQRQNPGFDVVIANPPYVGVKGHSDIFEPIRKGRFGKFYSGRGELFYFFFHLALDIGRDKSSIVFITTNYYPTATYGNLLRKDIKERAQIISLINFNELRIFETALGQHNMITLLQKSKDKDNVARNIITKRKGMANPSLLLDILNGQDKETEYYEVYQNDLFEGPENYIRLTGISEESNKINSILNKLSINPPLSEICYVRQGLRTGIDKISKSHKEKYGFEGKLGEGVFVLSKKEIENLGLNDKERGLVKDFYKNSDILKFYTDTNTSRYVLYIDKKYNEQKLKKEFPNVYNHLLRYEKLILKIRERNKEKLRKWVNLDRPREKFIFTSPKIIAPQRSYENTFAFNEEDWYASADVYYIIQKNRECSLKFILGLINSKLYYVWLYLKGKRKGEMLELYQKPLSEIPIKKISPSQQKPFIKLVDQILKITQSKDYLDNPDKQAKVKKLEKEIDQLVYKLYDLTPKEIKIVEEFNEK